MDDEHAADEHFNGNTSGPCPFPPDEPAPRLCDYCETVPAEGYVAAYDAHVCDDCYHDHHGPPFEWAAGDAI